MDSVFLKSAHLYEKLIASYSVPPSSLIPARSNASSTKLELSGESRLSVEGQRVMRNSVLEFAAMELHLQQELIRVSINELLTTALIE